MCDKDSFRSTQQLFFFFFVRFSCLFTSSPTPLFVEFVYSSLLRSIRSRLSEACFYLLHQKQKSWNESERRIYRLNVLCKASIKKTRKTFTFSVESNGDDAAGMTGAVIVARHQTLPLSFECEIRQLIVSRAEANIILNLLASSLLYRACSAFCRNSHVALSLALFFRLLFVTVEAYEAISSHLIF